MSSLPPPSASLPTIEEFDTEYLQVSEKLQLFRPITYDDLVDPIPTSTPIPDSRTLEAVIQRLKQFGDLIEKRSKFSDFAVRAIAQLRSQELQHAAHQDNSGQKGTLKKKRKATDQPPGGGESPVKLLLPFLDTAPSVFAEKKCACCVWRAFHLSTHPRKLDSRGAFFVSEFSTPWEKKKTPHADLELITARPDRSPTQHHHLGKNPRKYGRAAADSSSSSLSPTNSPSAMNAEDKNKVDDDSQSSSEDEGRPPERAKPQSQTFGDDPAIFPDPTVYEIRDVTQDMTDEQRKEIYSVAVFPRSDLADMIAGDPPEKDFSNTKPTNQISFATFSSYIEPFFRPFNDEDLAFLRERSDRLLTFQIPKRGKKHYTDIWAEEDGAIVTDSSSRHDRFSPNQARGSIDALDDDVAETDKLSLPPLVSRLLCAMRPENRSAPADDNAAASGANGANGANGEMVYSGGDLDTAMADPLPPPPAPTDVIATNLPAATHIPEFNMEAFKKGTSARLEHHAVDERLKQELQHVGFLGMESSDEVDYDAQQDDEVCARLRHLQERLRKQILVNGARKARLTDCGEAPPSGRRCRGSEFSCTGQRICSLISDRPPVSPKEMHFVVREMQTHLLPHRTAHAAAHPQVDHPKRPAIDKDKTVRAKVFDDLNNPGHRAGAGCNRLDMLGADT